MSSYKAAFVRAECSVPIVRPEARELQRIKKSLLAQAQARR